MKNEGSLLPLAKDKLKSIALIGLAKEFLGQGGGSAAVNAHRKITAYDAIQESLTGAVDIKYAEGARIWRNLPALSEEVVDLEGRPGFSKEL